MREKVLSSNSRAHPRIQMHFFTQRENASAGHIREKQSENDLPQIDSASEGQRPLSAVPTWRSRASLKLVYANLLGKKESSDTLNPSEA